ncbi:hypothetical protein ABZU78_29910 [Rhodococcus erythropolis]|uniref:hypothetical protein n=1 Tax=Rhodococcus erythropolis TaxID=1833 RepID=UPI0033B36944
MKRTLAQRAAYRCSNPGCGALTIGPGPDFSHVEVTGTAAHIYAAAANGPRGTGGLTEEQRSSPANGIWLCAGCARLVDTNGGSAYPASLLQGWRDLHETRIRMEHGGVTRPIGWLASIDIREDVWIAEPTTVRFSRCNVFIGTNGSGKTHFLSLLSALASPSKIMERSSRPGSAVHAEITWYDPHLRRAEFRAEGHQLHVTADGSAVPFVSQPYRIVQTQNPSLLDLPNDVQQLGELFGLDPWAVTRLLLSLPDIVGGAVLGVRIVDGQVRAEYTSSCHAYGVDRPFRLTGVLAIEVLVALAETYARTQPTVLLLDTPFAAMAIPEDAEHAVRLLSSPARGFQTVVVSTASAMRYVPELRPEWTVTHMEYDYSVSRRTRLVQDRSEQGS